MKGRTEKTCIALDKEIVVNSSWFYLAVCTALLLTVPAMACAVDTPPAAFTEGTRVLFQGDSITDGGRGRQEAHLDHTLGHGYPYIIAGNLGGHFPELRLTFLNRGISGHKVSDLVARWQRDTIDLKPDILSILIGINDVWHNLGANKEIRYDEIETAYDKLIADTKVALPSIKIVLCEPFLLPGKETKDRWNEWEPATRKIQTIVSRLGEKHKLPIVRFQKIFDEAVKRAPSEYWLFDGVHPFYAGNQLMADEWIRTVREFWQK